MSTVPRPILPRRAALSASLLLSLAGAAAPARAQLFELVMEGALDARSSLVTGGITTPLGGLSPFTLRAVFDVSTQNHVAPIGVPGFVAYTPASVEFTLGGRTYAMAGYSTATPAGIAVSIFDATTPFGPPGRYGVGIIQDPLLDGAGFVADYLGASPPFTIATGGIVPTTFTGYQGVGVQGGACLAGSPETGCQQYAVTAIPLTWSGQSFGLVLGNYIEEAAEGRPYTARIAAVQAVVPEPATVALVGAGVLVVGAVGARRRRA
jgi:hypothetical protein